jgi:hypothetical protein
MVTVAKGSTPPSGPRTTPINLPAGAAYTAVGSSRIAAAVNTINANASSRGTARSGPLKLQSNSRCIASLILPGSERGPACPAGAAPSGGGPPLRRTEGGPVRREG